MLRTGSGTWRVMIGRSGWIIVRSMPIRTRGVRRCCGFLRAARTDESACLSIAMAAWLTAHGSETGIAANGATTTTAGAADGKAKSATKEKDRGKDKGRGFFLKSVRIRRAR